MLEAIDLACVRGDRPLFSGLNFKISPGEAIYVGGANGAGKTSLLRLLCGLAEPAHGEVRWFGESIRKLREEFSVNVLYLGHAAALKDELSACENLVVGAAISGHSVSREVACAALVKMGLKGREDLPARALSQGQRRRVNLARLVLPQTPRLWVLDEPFNALDVKAVAQLRGLMAEHVAADGTVIYTTHQEVDFPPDRLRRIVIDGGRATPC